MAKNTRQRLLELMVARVGHKDLAKRLDVPPGILEDWLSGSSIMSDAKLVTLVNLIDETSDDL